MRNGKPHINACSINKSKPASCPADVHRSFLKVHNCSSSSPMLDPGHVPPGSYATLLQFHPLTHPLATLLCSRLVPVLRASTHTTFRVYGHMSNITFSIKISRGINFPSWQKASLAPIARVSANCFARWPNNGMGNQSGSGRLQSV